MRYLPGILMALLLALAACGGSDSGADVNRADATALFREQKKILLAYIDTLENSKDSAALARATTGLDDALSRAAQHHQPDADFLLTLGQQDTLAMLTRKYVTLRTSKARTILPKDSTVTDSVH